MESLLQFVFLSILISFCLSTTSVVAIVDEDLITTSPASTVSSSPFPQSPLSSQENQDASSATAVLEPILTNLGFHELAAVVPSLTDSAFTTWNGLFTLFAPSDASIRTCHSCSVTQLIREHIIPGIYPIDYLGKLSFGTKIESMNPGRCITVTSADNNSRMFIDAVEITRPELFNNGIIVIHGLDEGFVSPLSPFSCTVERMTPLSLPPQPSVTVQTFSPSPILRPMLRDAMLRLRNNGFSVLSLALRVKYAELVNLQSMTVFALDDLSIFSGGHAYISNVRFHIVPNRFLTYADLEKLPAGTALPSLEHGQMLVVTTAGGGAAPMRINYVRIKVPDVMHNLKIVVHGVFLPFPHLHPAASFGGLEETGWEGAGAIGSGGIFHTKEGEETVSSMSYCAASDKKEGCVAAAPSPMYLTTVKTEDRHGL